MKRRLNLSFEGDGTRIIMNLRGGQASDLPNHITASQLSRTMKISSSLPFLSLFLLANAYTWQFTSQPVQCEDITITLQGSGKPPYSLLIVPHGSTPLPNGTEVRKVQDIPFSGSSTTFKLPYPENSSFVAVVCSYLTCICFVYCSCRSTGQR